MRYVYALIDPAYGVKRYIGQTEDVKKRLASHLSDRNRRSGPVSMWLRSVLSGGRSPIASVIRAGDWSIVEAEAQESAAIAESLEHGDPLLNVRLRPFIRTTVAMFRLRGRHAPVGITKKQAKENMLAVQEARRMRDREVRLNRNGIVVPVRFTEAEDRDLRLKASLHDVPLAELVRRAVAAYPANPSRSAVRR